MLSNGLWLSTIPLEVKKPWHYMLSRPVFCGTTVTYSLHFDKTAGGSEFSLNNTPRYSIDTGSTWPVTEFRQS